jgi:hypothetical protein
MDESDSIFRDIAVALAFGKQELPPVPYARTQEEIDRERAVGQKQREIDEARRDEVLAGRAIPKVLMGYFLRPAEIKNACHAMALHLLSEEDRAIATACQWVRLVSHGDSYMVEFLQDEPISGIRDPMAEMRDQYSYREPPDDN